MWRLIVGISLTRLSVAQRAVKTSFLGMSVKVFPGEISIWISRLRRRCPHWYRWASPHFLKAWISEFKKRKYGGDTNSLSLLDLGHLSSPGSSVFSFLEPPCSHPSIIVDTLVSIHFSFSPSLFHSCPNCTNRWCVSWRQGSPLTLPST